MFLLGFEECLKLLKAVLIWKDYAQNFHPGQSIIMLISLVIQPDATSDCDVKNSVPSLTFHQMTQTTLSLKSHRKAPLLQATSGRLWWPWKQPGEVIDKRFIDWHKKMFCLIFTWSGLFVYIYQQNKCSETSLIEVVCLFFP